MTIINTAYQYDVVTNEVTRIIKYPDNASLDKYIADNGIDCESQAITHGPAFGFEGGLIAIANVETITLRSQDEITVDDNFDDD